MGDDWVLIGYEESEQLAVISRQHYVIVTKRAVAVDTPALGLVG